MPGKFESAGYCQEFPQRPANVVETTPATVSRESSKTYSCPYRKFVRKGMMARKVRIATRRRRGTVNWRQEPAREGEETRLASNQQCFTRRGGSEEEKGERVEAKKGSEARKLGSGCR